MIIDAKYFLNSRVANYQQASIFKYHQQTAMVSNIKQFSSQATRNDWWQLQIVDRSPGVQSSRNFCHFDETRKRLAYTNKKNEGVSGGRGRKSRICATWSRYIRHTTKPPEVPQSPVPGLYPAPAHPPPPLSRRLALAKQCGPRKNKEINTVRQRPAVWIRNLSPRLFVLRSFTYCLPQ